MSEHFRNSRKNCRKCFGHCRNVREDLQRPRLGLLESISAESVLPRCRFPEAGNAKLDYTNDQNTR